MSGYRVLVLTYASICVLVQQSCTLRTHDVTTNFHSYFHEWLVFKKTYNKGYGDLKTDMERYEVFKSNLQYIEEHNRLYEQGVKSFHLGINVFTDLSHEEFVKRMRLDVLMDHRTEGATDYLPFSFMQLPDSVDWRTKGYVTPVKDQGQCGSCWSFSTTGSMEGQHFKKTNQLISLSEQQLVDCSLSYGDHGCKGGIMDYAFDYIKDKGSESETSYPYKAKQYDCRYNASLVVAKCIGHVDVPRYESALKSAVGTVGPVSVAIDASHKSFQHYKGGVYDEPKCSTSRLDHGVLAVGYGTGDSDYWLVKNSWGPSWGDKGYINMSRNKNNQCGIASEASYPLV